MSYGNNLQDFTLQQITYTVGATPVSQFSYGRDIPRMQITTWSQQAGAQSPSIFSFGYDAGQSTAFGGRHQFRRRPSTLLPTAMIPRAIV